MKSRLQGFRGDLAFVRAFEGHVGRPYHPGGTTSGITLDPGVDLGQGGLDLADVVKLYGFGEPEAAAIACVWGLKGPAARKALKASEVLRGIRVSRDQAAEIFPRVATQYWDAITRRFPLLLHATTPDSVQTVLLSLAVNRGANNRHLEVLHDPIGASDWHHLGELVRGMQQGHQLEGIRSRRRAEGNLILKETDGG